MSQNVRLGSVGVTFSTRRPGGRHLSRDRWLHGRSHVRVRRRLGPFFDPND